MILWMYPSTSLGMLKLMTCSTFGMSRPLAVAAVATQNGRITCFEVVQSLLVLILQTIKVDTGGQLLFAREQSKICLFLRVDEDYGQLAGSWFSSFRIDISLLLFLFPNL